MDDPLTGGQGLVLNDFAQDGGKGFVKLIGVLVAQAGGQGALRVYVHQQDALALAGQADA